MFDKRNPVQNYFNKISSFLLEKLDQYPIEQLCEYTDDELNDYFINNFKIEKIDFDLDNKHRTFIQTKIKQYNNFYNIGKTEAKKCVLVDALEFTFSIPVVSGDINLLVYHPNAEIICMYEHPDTNYRINDDTRCVDVVFNVENSKLNSTQVNDKNTYIENIFSEQTRELNFMKDRLNSEFEQFNDSLLQLAKNQIEKKKKEKDFINMIIQSTGIELKAITQTAQTGLKIPVKPKIKKEPKPFPEVKKVIEEYSLDDDQYRLIMNYLYNFLSSAESNPQTMCKLEEEDIRNIILWALNTNFGIATGETFRKNGKTDICINFKNKEAFIAECKVWKGEKALLEAVDQLDGYSTWRDVRTALLFFNKDRVNFDDAISAFKHSIKQHIRYLSMKEIKKNYFECNFKNNVGNDPVVITFIISNFFVK